MTMTNENIRRLLSLVSKHDVCESLNWTDDLDFAVNCSDVFWWGCADAEPVTDETLDVLEQSLIDGGLQDGMPLYCSRMRKMRPQGAMYKHIENPELFNVFPERVVDTGNPVEQPKAGAL